MENTIKTQINWQNAEVYSPQQYKDPIIYCTDENKVGILDNTITSCKMDDNWKVTYYSDWETIRNFYHIKWWCYCDNVVPYI